MDKVGVWTRPTVVKKKPPLRLLKAVIARVPLMPTSQSASDLHLAASESGIISSSLRRCEKPSLIALAVIDCNQRRFTGCVALVCWAMRRKISSPSRPASHALTSCVTSFLLISFCRALRRDSVFTIGLNSNLGGITGKLLKDHFPRLTSNSSGAMISNKCPTAEEIMKSDLSK